MFTHVFGTQCTDPPSVRPQSRFVMGLVKLVFLLGVGCFGMLVQADMAYVADGGNKVHVIDTSNNRIVAAIPVGDGPTGVAVNRAGTRVYVANSSSNTISVIDTGINQVIATVPVEISPYNLVVNPSGTRVYVTHYDSSKVSVIDTGTNSVVASVTVENHPDGIAINPAGTRVYVANTESDSVSVIDTGTNQVMDTMKVGYKPYGVAVNPSGTRVYVTSERTSGKPTFNVIDVSNDANQVVDTVEAGWHSSPYGMVVNPAGTLIYVGDQFGSEISVIDANTNKLVTTVQVGKQNVFNVAINPSGTRVYVTHFSDGSISVIDTNTNKEIAGIFPENNSGVAFGVAIGTVPCNTVTEIPIAECQELLNLFHSTNGTNWRNKTGWNQNNTPCSWAGITCAGGHVTEINLSGNNLSGSLPNLNLPSLQVFGLRQNFLISGNIPDFSNLPNLQSLELGDNQLSGSIPDFSKLSNLQHLHLWNNQLSGSIPDFSNLSNLQSLSLSNNQLTGNIPSFSNLPNLHSLDLSRNQLTGSIPNFNLPALKRWFMLGSNCLSGIIPKFTSFDLAKLNNAAFNNNGGLVAYDAAQEVILNQKDRNWKTRNPSCPAEPAKCEDPAKHAKYSIATGKVSIPFTDLPALKTDSPEATGGMAVFKNLRLQFFKDQDFKVVASTVTPDTSKEPVGDPCHAVYTYATRTLRIPKVEVPTVISNFPKVTEGKPINVYEVTLQHIETNPVDLGIVRIKDATLIETIK